MKLNTMEKEFTSTNLEEIRAMAQALLSASDACEVVADKEKIEEDLSAIIDHYAVCSKNETYRAARASGDAMKYAVTTFYYPVIKVKEPKNEGEARYIDNGARPIDLGDLHKKLDGIGANKHWIYTAETLNYYLTIRAAQRVGATVKNDSFKMHEIARQIDLGKNPCSNTNMLKTLQRLVEEMLGEGYKATSHDVNYLIDVYANDNKKSKTGITAANHKTLRNYLKKVCYRILTGSNGYDVDQREIKA